MHTLFNKIEKFNSGESEEDFPEKEAPLKDSTNEPEKTEPATSKTRKKTSASSSLEREKPGPSSYQKNEPKKTEPAASKIRKKPSASSSLEREKPGPSGYQKRQRGKYVEQKKPKQVTLLKNKIEITAKFRKDHRLFNKLGFRYYYDNPTKLLNDFKEYREVTSSNPISTTKSSTDNALTMVNNIRQVWTAIDPARSIFPRNSLIEDYFFHPQLQLSEQNLKLPKEEQTHHIQASTIKSKLLCVSTFCKFLYHRGIFININTEELNRVQSKVQELCSTLKKHIG